MSGDQTSHMTVTYKSGGNEFASTYAISEDALILSKLQDWIETNVVHLDRDVARFNDDETSHITVYYKSGSTNLTRREALSNDVLYDASILSKLQDWLERNGVRLDCSNGPAVVKHFADGSALERYYRDGERHREDGPAATYYRPYGTTVKEEYYLNDELVKVERPAPKPPNTPGAQPS